MQQHVQRQGVIYALCAYTLWGLAPIYFKTIAAVPAAEILTHRMIWSCALLLVLTLLGRQWHKVQAVLRQPKVLLTLAFTSITVGGNWLLFIWAINNGHMLDASLGYYINPLFNVLLGMLFLSEKLRRLQWWAVGLAAIGVAIQIIAFGSLPWIALVLASSFAIYGLIRKKLALDALTGLLIETLIMLPPAAIYLWGIADSPTSHLTQNDWHLNLLLIAAGAVTTAPLLCFTAAATRLKLSTLGFFQYIGPSLMFILAVTLYGEALALDKMITFAFIWSALVLFSLDGLRSGKRRQAAEQA
ncbi:TPA: EamA family transporter RarD [Aeromonas dhakensis]|uniref:EamA family transporter RarD n=1 Tax=Aeromonas TaxID=642 RepID=UPI000348651C|nr:MULTISPECIES: EamA family transporter RarD [Aeromonas]KMK91160.1 chloramphenical resistance permease RarD [Aeromonas enteropelogenes]HDX8358146.1 EamA family transporter RarD [Aeromonas hydrophila]ASX10168.1 protein RarD [Aeromonas dhakensis]EIM1709858.1 EamA family transporter RarD [Aeromonas dhakensis]ELM3751594.1 EamA family transporter RarD [Aeromonas dhakensis]